MGTPVHGAAGVVRIPDATNIAVALEYLERDAGFAKLSGNHETGRAGANDTNRVTTVDGRHRCSPFATRE